MLSPDHVRAALATRFGERMHLTVKRPGIFQLHLPIYHEDGDQVEIYVAASPEQDGWLRVSDYAMTIMRLSYEYELDSENKQRIFREVVAQNRVQELNGVIYLDTPIDELMPAVLQMAQAIAKVGTMRYFGREAVRTLFYEEVDRFIMEELEAYRPVRNLQPLIDRPELEASYALHPNGRPVYLFPVRDASSAKTATITCLEFDRANLPFVSAVVLEDFGAIPRRDQAFLASACDKQFPSLADFKQHATRFLAREARHSS